MKVQIHETSRGKEFVFYNKFSLNRISRDDRKLNSFLRFKYNLITKFHLSKFYNNRSWFHTMNHYWSNLSSKEAKALKKRRKKENIHLTKKDITLEEIVIYDLLPKEYIFEFQSKYIKFKDYFAKESMFNRRPKDLTDAFNNMSNSRGTGCWFNVDWFGIKSDTELGKTFASIKFEVIGLTESFYILKYNLMISNDAKALLSEILTANIHKSAFCISNGKWWKKKSFSGCALYDFGNDGMSHTLEDYILELKSIFWEEVEDKLFSKFFGWNIIPPSIEIYSSETLSKNKDKILSVISPHGRTDIEHNKQEEVFFLTSSDNHHKKGAHNSKIIADYKQFEGRDDGQLYPFLEIEETICQGLANYFVLDAISENVAEAIYASQLKINKSVYSKAKFRSLLKIKLKIDKQLYFYKRLYKELTPQIEKHNNEDYRISSYKNVFINKLKTDNPNLNIDFSFASRYDSLLYTIQEKHIFLKSIYEHFEENAKMVESRYNYNLVKWTFWVGFLSLLAAILLANDSFLLKYLWNWIKSIL